jgi:hypothetical protein
MNDKTKSLNDQGSMDAIFRPPMSKAAWVGSHVAWALRHPVKLAVVSLAAIPAVRRHVLFTTPIKDHSMWPTMERSYRAQINDLWKRVGDHPAGCFYGSFAEAYPDNWHIPWNVDCPLDHGPDPIKLQPPSGGVKTRGLPKLIKDGEDRR